MGAAARAAGILIVTGDTKIVERGAADKLFINTAGIGWQLTTIVARRDRGSAAKRDRSNGHIHGKPSGES